MRSALFRRADGSRHDDARRGVSDADQLHVEQRDQPGQHRPEPFVLRSTQLDFDYETGFRILGRYDCGPLSVIEFGYWGVENLDSSASFTDPNPVDADTGNLYSLFSYYGNTPPGVTTPGGPVPWTERSDHAKHLARIGAAQRGIQLPPLLGRLQSDGLRHAARRLPLHAAARRFPVFAGDRRSRSADYDEIIKNDMAGFQAGGDVWVHIRQGIRIGAEGKVGLMNNHYTLDNSFVGSARPKAAARRRTLPNTLKRISPR